MRVINKHNYDAMVDTIIKEREKTADKLDKPFEGLTRGELDSEITRRLGDNWVIQRDRNVKFSKSDINAVANSRFYRKSGIKYLLGLAVAVLLVAVIVNTFKSFPIALAYALFGAEGIAFVWLYSKKQAVVRKELWRDLGRNEDDEV